MPNFKEHEKNQGNMILLKGHNNLPVTDLKDMETCAFPSKEFKTAVLRKLKDLQKNTEI